MVLGGCRSQFFNFSDQELLGTLKAIEDNRSMSAKNKEAALVEILKHYSKGAISEPVRNIISVALSMFDSAVLNLWSRLSWHGMQWEHFIKIQKEMVSLIVGSGDLDIVLACGGEFATCGAAIRRLRSSSQVGASLFCSAATICAGKALQEASWGPIV